MDRLPKELRDYLYEIAPHEDEPRYLQKRIEKLGYEEAKNELDMLFALSDRNLVTLPRERVDKRYVIRPLRSHPAPGATLSHGDGMEVVFSYPTMFGLTYDGRNHRLNSRRSFLRRMFGIVLTAILSGFAAWLVPSVASWQLFDRKQVAEFMTFSEAFSEQPRAIHAALLEVLPSSTDLV